MLNLISLNSSCIHECCLSILTQFLQHLSIWLVNYYRLKNHYMCVATSGIQFKSFVTEYKDFFPLFFFWCLFPYSQWNGFCIVKKHVQSRSYCITKFSIFLFGIFFAVLLLLYNIPNTCFSIVLHIPCMLEKYKNRYIVKLIKGEFVKN